MLFAFSSQKLDVRMHAGLSADQLPQSSAFEELLEVMTRAVAKFNSTMMPQLSPACMDLILAAMGIRPSHSKAQAQLGLMAAAVNIIPLGRLHMIPFQFWFLSRGFHSLNHPSRVIKVMNQGLHILHLWKRSWFLTLSSILGRGIVCMPFL